MDSDARGFPTYAELTRTQGWAGSKSIETPEIDAVEQSASGRYEETSVLGIGGMGKVVLAKDVRIGRDVALKVLHGERGIQPVERRRFLREAQVQGQLEHPAIVPVYDIDRSADGSTFFTMRRVIGSTLAQVIEDHRAGTSKHSVRELLQAFNTVCLTVEYAHSRGIVHRDLKPANIMLGEFGEVYVLDWGLARMAGSERLSVPGGLLGTPLYMAPEQIDDPEVGPAADVWSLGAILFEILALVPLRDPRAVFAPIDPRLRKTDRELAPELLTICVRATAEVSERFATARALSDAVARYLDGDRELAQRRALAAKHAEQARAALASATATDPEHARGIAMRELIRAVALDPTSSEHINAFATVASEVPQHTPPEVRHTIAAREHILLRRGTRYTGLAMLSWLLFLPLLLLAGVRDAGLAVWIIIPAILAATVALVAARMPRIDRPVQCVIMAIMLVAAIASTRLFGPLLVVPSLLATWAVVMQAHPDRTMRVIGLIGPTVGMMIPVVLELAGVLPSSYLFEGDGFRVVPQLAELPQWFVLGFVGLGSVGIAVMPALFIARLRDDLSRIQEREAVRSWHFQRLGEIVRS
ncbi:MAG TPA: serine/threonine-protein kinase [Kofleriaceae bacterium]